VKTNCENQPQKSRFLVVHLQNHHFNSCNRRATSSALARLLKALMRKYPSPF
jgi:hypothetical protein